jgi:VCBS repeat-containing protein
VGQFLSDDADLLLYGCSIAETADGQVIVDTLSQLTSTDVAASTDITGHFSLGGDWDLEYRVGSLESSLAFSEDLQGNWQYTMVTYTLLDNFASASYSNNNGTNNFSGSWTESDAGGAGAGSGNQLITGGQLRLQPVNAANWIYRDANLSGANTATVSFYYNSTLDNNASNTSIMFQVSSDGGSNYTTLYTFDKTTNITSGTLSSDISSYISSNMRFRFDVGTAAAGSYYLYVDDFQVSYGVNTAPSAVVDNATAVEASGVNNGTAGTNPTGNVLTNDTDADAGDTKTVSGVAAGVVGSASTNVGTNVSGTYGTINIASNGSYTYTVNNSNSAVQALYNTSNTLTDVFTYTMRDTLGLTSTTQVTVTIQGANDTPSDISGTLSVSENAANGTSVGTLTGSDVDAPVTTPTIYVNENFESGATGWSNNTTETATSFSTFLGRFAGSGGAQAVSKTFTLASNLQVAVVEFDLYRIDSWDGESFRVFVNDTQSISLPLTMGVGFTQTSGTTGNVSWVATPVTSASNVEFGGWDDQQIRITMTITQPTASLKVGFGSTLDQAVSDESYGIDNFKITGNGVAYSLTDTAGGRFAINTLTGAVTVANSSLLNYESATSHNITVRATDVGGATYDETFAVALTDVDEFDVGAVSDTNATSDSVNENAANGTTVGVTAFASDADGSNNTITYTLDNNAGGRFSINSASGVVTVANSSLLNYESATSHSITVRATSADGSFSTQNFTINLNDVDEFDVGSVTDTNASANSLAENSANGTSVGITASASDADATNNTITFSLDDSAGGRFSIHASTGVITVANSTLLNYESASSHNVTVRATSADGSSSTQIFTINLTDVDEFDVGTVTDSNASANSIAENSANGTAVGLTASATDADGSNNTITYSLDDTAGGRFTIHSSTGVVTVANNTLLNYEAATSHNITVRATSADGSFSTQVFTINLTDADEFDVGTVTDTNATSNSLAENSANGTAVGITASATDADATNNTITYSLDDSAGGRFAVHASTGVVTVANSTLLNFESSTTHNITVRATSADGSFSTQIFTISLTDVDEFDVGTVSDTNAAANSIAENTANGTVVGITGSASDADATNNTITYTLDDSAGGRFAVHTSTGVVTVANGTLLNFEAATSHNITVRATSADGSFSTQVFTINLTDVDEFDVGTVTDSNATANTLAENTSNGTAVGITASASDADGSNNSITYTLDDSASGRFTVHATTGVVTVANSTLLNYEAATSHNITVRATSADGSFSTQVFTINLTDVDEFDVGTVTDSNATANAIAENTANGTAVGITASASDADATNNTISYTLDDNAGGRFSIHTSTGVITVANSTLLNYEAATSHNVTVRATSADGSFSTQVFTIALTDVDEFDVGSVTDTNASANSLAENSANGSVVGITASASDADATNNAITYTLDDNSSGRFAIHSSTGVVTVANSTLLNYESATSHNITLRATSADGSFSTQVFSISLTTSMSLMWVPSRMSTRRATA